MQEALHWRDEKYKKTLNFNNLQPENSEIHDNEVSNNTIILLKDLNVSVTPHLLSLDLPQGSDPVGPFNTPKSTGKSSSNFISTATDELTSELIGKVIANELNGKFETGEIKSLFVTGDINQSLKSTSKIIRENSKIFTSDENNDYDGEYYNEYDKKGDKIHYKNKNKNFLTLPSNILDLKPEALMELVVSFKSAYTNLSQVCVYIYKC